MRPPSLRTVELVVGASIVLTAFHFTDNYVSIDTYPQGDWVTRPVVLIGWVVLTAFGVGGYLLYRRERFPAANACLLVYSYTGLSSLGHFLSGSPDEFTTRGLVSVLIDGAAGSAVLALAVWSILARQREATPAGEATPEREATPAATRAGVERARREEAQPGG
jgi:hypothetical protein